MKSNLSFLCTTLSVLCISFSFSQSGGNSKEIVKHKSHSIYEFGLKTNQHIKNRGLVDCDTRSNPLPKDEITSVENLGNWELSYFQKEDMRL